MIGLASLRMMCIVAALFCCAVGRAETASEFLERIELDKAKFLCTWKDAHTPGGNPLPLDICAAAPVPSEVVHAQARDWWQYWSRLNANAAASLRNRFEEDWRRARTAEARRLDAMSAARREAAFATKAAKLTDEELCIRFSKTKSKAARGELVARHALSEDEWSLVDSKHIRIGMSEIALLCAWGLTDVNRTVTAGGVTKQYVYGRTYVYVDNGRVTAYQD